MADQNKENIEKEIEEEEIEEKENNNQMHEEYEEEGINQGNEEEGQEFSVAFDIQINEGSFILLVGKTDERKLILRLVDKEEDNKPFYQNEFSLEELKEINSYFNPYNNEDDAINCVIKHLNESEKEIEIIDDNNIKLSIIINEEKNNTKIDFVLMKVTFVLEGEEEVQEKIQNNENNEKNNLNSKNEEQNLEQQEERIEEEMDNLEEENEEGIEESDNEKGEEEKDKGEQFEEDNLEYSDENLEKNTENIGKNAIKKIEKNINKEEINKKSNLSENSPFINISNNIQNKNALQTIIEETTNENNIIVSESDKPIVKQKKELEIKNESNKQNEAKEEKSNNIQKDNTLPDSRISKVIEELKDNLDSLEGAMNYIEQEEDDQEQNTNENELNKNINEELMLFKNEFLKTISALSDNFNSQLQKQNNYFIEMKEQEENKFKEIKNELSQKDTQLNEAQNLLNEKIYIMERNINKINEEINIIKEDLKNSTNKEINSSNKKQMKSKSEKEIIKPNYNDFENLKNDLNSKLKEIELKMNEMENEITKNNKNVVKNNNLINNDLNTLDNKIKALEEIIKNIENKKHKEKKNNDFVKIDKEIYEKMEDLSNEIKEIKKKNDKIYNTEINIKELINKVNYLINCSKSYEFKNIEKEIKKIKQMENKNILMHSNDDFNQEKKEKDNEMFQKVITAKINLTEESKKQNIKTNSRTNAKKLKKLKKNQPRNLNEEENYQKEMITKNYRVIKHIEDNNTPSKKYMSKTYNKGNTIFTSHSVNRFSIKKKNSLDKNDIEYQVLTRPRSKSKEHKRNRELENISNDTSQLSISKKYRDINPPIPKEVENSITESRIVEYDDFIFVENRIKEIYPNLNIDFNLVYRASEDGDKSLDFHNKCDKIGPNVTIVKTKKDYVFGGFTAKNWEHLKRDINVNKPNLGSASRDIRAFGFCVNIQKIYNNEKPDEFAIWCNRNYGPTFKNNFFQIFDNCFKKGGYCSAKKNSHFGGQEYDYEISGGESKFRVEEVEVYEIKFQ